MTKRKSTNRHPRPTDRSADPEPAVEELHDEAASDGTLDTADEDAAREEAFNEQSPDTDDVEQFQGVSGPSSPAPEPPRWASLDAAVDHLDLYFERSHGLSIDKAMVKEFVEYYHSLAEPPKS